MAKIQESGEMYLETIYVLQKKNGAVRSLDVAEHMGYSKPSVCRAVGLLKKSGHLLMERDGALLLTESGQAIAEKIYDRHVTLTDFLTRLGVPPEIASADACRIEHVVSDSSFEAIKKQVQSKADASPENSETHREK